MNGTIKHATFSAKLIARIIDGAILSFVAFLAAKVLITDTTENASAYQSDLLGVFFLLRWCLYYPIMETYGGTIGKRVMNIKTVKANTYEDVRWTNGLSKLIYLIKPSLYFLPVLIVVKLLVEFSDYEVSTVFMWIFNIYFCVQFLYFIIVPLIIKNGQSLHDRYAKTITIKNKENMG